MFESSVELTPEQIEWLDEFTEGTWELNPHTGLVEVSGDFGCSGEGLSDFKGVRFGVIESGFFCDKNQLTSLEGAPQEVGDVFVCDFNQLTTLEGAPQKVGDGFSCQKNELTSLEGAPRMIRGSFYCGFNPVSEETLNTIFSHMRKGESYLDAVESLWPEISLEDQTLLYRPEFEWVGPDEVKKLDTLRAYQGFKGMI